MKWDEFSTAALGLGGLAIASIYDGQVELFASFAALIGIFHMGHQSGRESR